MEISWNWGKKKKSATQKIGGGGAFLPTVRRAKIANSTIDMGQIFFDFILNSNAESRGGVWRCTSEECRRCLLKGGRLATAAVNFPFSSPRDGSLLDEQPAPVCVM